MRISSFIFLGFLLILVLFSITTFINYRQAEKVNENSDFFARSTTVVRHSNRFQRNIMNMVSGLRGYLLTGENYFIQAYDSAAIENQNILKEISAFIPENTTQKQAFREIVQLNDQWVEEFAQPLIDAKKRIGDSDTSERYFNRLYREKLVIGNEKNINRALQIKFRDFSNYEYDLREQHRVALEAMIKQTGEVSFYLTSLSILLGLAIALFLAYRISSRILSMVRMADTIASGNYGVYTEDTGKDELSHLAHSLNHMSKVLSENIALLKRKNEELDQFAHIVSHDLKAPLRGIDNVITWIEEDHTSELSPKMAGYIQLIRSRLVRAENLIRGILSYARVSRERPHLEEVDLNALLREIMEGQPTAPGLKVEIPANLPRITTEKIALQQVLSNLIVNAIKHHDKPDGWVRIGFSVLPTVYAFTVEDNGPGIAKHYHDKIFEMFQTLQEKETFENTGVGLAIVKKIVRDRNQDIRVTSEPGVGSVFAFTWPKQ